MNEKDLNDMCKELSSLGGVVIEDSLKELSEDKAKDTLELAKRMREHLANDGTTFIKATKDGVDL